MREKTAGTGNWSVRAFREEDLPTMAEIWNPTRRGGRLPSGQGKIGVITRRRVWRGLFCNMAVSYTHLDVYKRQGLVVSLRKGKSE